MIDRLKKNMLIPYVAVAFTLLGLILQPFNDFIIGYKDILISESILLTDYVEVGGIGPALFNAGTLMLLSYYIIKKIDIPITGAIFAGIFTIGGFALFGKNVLNVSIVYIGVSLYAKYKRVQLRNVIVVFLFATGLSPISSVVMFGLGYPLYIGVPLGIFIGVLSGFILVELSQKALAFHRGYDLYNVGFASGIIAFSFFSIIKMKEVEYTTNLIYNNESHLLLLILFIVLCLIYLILGIVMSKNNLKDYKKLLRLSGIAVTDFTRRSGMGLTMFNAGLTGLVTLLLLLVIGVRINGPVLGGLMTIFGFAAFGKHVKNALPPMIGVALVTVILGLDFSVPVILAIIFSTALAPVAGEHGIIVGILAGMLHLPVVTSLGQIHGGIVLYSNGFAAAFTAVIITTFVSTFKRRES